MTEPSASSTLSLVVGTARVALPEVEMLTVCEPVEAKSPLCETVTLTVRSAAGAGVAVTVKLASVPSLTSPSEATLISGVVGGGGGGGGGGSICCSAASSMHSSASRMGFQPHQRVSRTCASAAVIAVRFASSTSPKAIRTRFQFSP